MKKRAGSLLLTFVMLLSLLVLPAQAVSQKDITLKGDAYYDSDNGWYVLTPDKTWQAGALWFSQVRCNDNFSLEFDYYTGHANHNDIYHGADGICVAFYAKGGQTGADGQGLGFDGCGGYGVEIDTFYNVGQGEPENNHIAIIKDRVNNHLKIADATKVSEDYQWHHLKVENRRNVCTVYVDGIKVLQQTDVSPNGQYEIGITAGTGAGKNLHAVKNIRLTEAVWANASQWADNELERAQQKNLIPTVLYDKDMTGNITRAEFASVAVRLYEEWTGTTAPAPTSPFVDIAGTPSKTDIQKAAYLGITNGTSDTTFDPNTNITREQLAAMLTRVYKKVSDPNWTLANDDFYLDISGVKTFADDSKIYDYAKPSVYFMAKHKIINGIGNNLFAPKATTSQEIAIGYALATREQALAMSLRSLENLGGK